LSFSRDIDTSEKSEHKELTQKRNDWKNDDDNDDT
jgi:hypothetical protein